jgi:hypothetical protein
VHQRCNMRGIRTITQGVRARNSIKRQTKERKGAIGVGYMSKLQPVNVRPLEGATHRVIGIGIDIGDVIKRRIN